MNGNGRDFCRSPGLKKERDIFGRKRLGHPSARVAREDLHGVASGIFGDDERLVEAALNRSVETNLWSSGRWFPSHEIFLCGNLRSLCVLCGYVPLSSTILKTL